LLQLIKAFKKVTLELEDRIKLYIVGSGIGDEKDKILNEADEMENEILFLGQLEQKELANRFRESDLFILPSFYDGFPKVMLEALASGCKVIITDLPGVKETMQQQIEGSLKKIQFLSLPKMKTIDQPLESELPHFVEQLKSKIIEVLSDSDPGLKDKDYAFSNLIRKNFGSDSLFKKYLEKYNEFGKD
jgi:glycosyltransferase involved in cell wall biosynthesis